MVRVEQLLYSKDNFAYIVYSNHEAIAIDPGCPDKITAFLKRKKLKLINILNTHSHFDHTGGNNILEEKTDIKLADMQELIKNKHLYVGDARVDIIATPGHTEDSVCIVADNAVITGDTMFIANAGNYIPELLKVFKTSLEAIMLLPDNLKVYPGHDYTERAVKRAMEIDPENEDIKFFWDKYDPPPVCSTVGDERKINPYVRTNTPAIKEHLKGLGKDVSSDFECFKSFLELY
ncbi:MAG: MBL fold metallo-hydrolase [bacterium]|nr:MBL fold metallo-hydrolase [bacterium]